MVIRRVLGILFLLVSAPYTVSPIMGQVEPEHAIAGRVASRPGLEVAANMLMLLKQPAGIVLSGGALCKPALEPLQTPASVQDVRQDLIEMGMSVEEEDGVMIVRDGSNKLQDEELEHVVVRFAPPPSTMSDEGAILDGIVTQEMDKPEAYIGGSVIGDRSHLITIQPQSNVTTKQLMNQLVRLDGKGVWILHKPVPLPEQHGKISHRGTIEVDSYFDDVPNGLLACRPADLDMPQTAHP